MEMTLGEELTDENVETRNFLKTASELSHRRTILGEELRDEGETRDFFEDGIGVESHDDYCEELSGEEAQDTTRDADVDCDLQLYYD